MHVLLTVHERLQLQQVVDAEQNRGQRGVPMEECCKAADKDAAAEHGGADTGQGGRDTMPSQVKRQKPRAGTRRETGKGPGKDAEGLGRRKERKGQTKTPARSMGSRLRERLSALTGE